MSIATISILETVAKNCNSSKQQVAVRSIKAQLRAKNRDKLLTTGLGIAYNS